MTEESLNSESELDRFRTQWRKEVTARTKRPEPPVPSAVNSRTSKPEKGKEPVSSLAPDPSATRPRAFVDNSDDIAPQAYHDLPNKEDQLKLGHGDQNLNREVSKEPKSALEHYEKAVERETQGMLGESIIHYRKAFKLDDGVHEAYKKKYFPPSSFKSQPANVNPSNATATVPNPAHHSLHGSTSALSGTLKQLIDGFSEVRIGAPPPPTDASPQESSLLGELPEEILIQILRSTALIDVASFARLAQVCKRLAFLVITEEKIWKHISMDEETGFVAMHYDFACDVEGFSLEANDEIARFLGSADEFNEDAEVPPTKEEKITAFSALTEELLRSVYSASWRQMFRSRPRIRFNGCYISTVNYTRTGATSTNTLSWGVPVHVVTYFRYLRFFHDGTVISLLSTSEPADVVHHLTKDNLHHHHGNALPSSVMKDALRGRWRLSGPASTTINPVAGEREEEGDVHVETEGVVPKYTYKLLLGLVHAGKGARNNKLAWKGFWSHNRLTDDWGEFGLKNDRAFYWSRVRSYRTRQHDVLQLSGTT